MKNFLDTHKSLITVAAAITAISILMIGIGSYQPTPNNGTFCEKGENSCIFADFQEMRVYASKGATIPLLQFEKRYLGCDYSVDILTTELCIVVEDGNNILQLSKDRINGKTIKTAHWKRIP